MSVRSRTGTLFGRTYLIAVVLNVAWERAQAPLYEPMGTVWQATRRCVIASIGDGLMILLVVAIGATVFRSGTWFVEREPGKYAFAILVGLVLAIVVELWGVTTDRWAYLASMPRVPRTDIGAVPLAQMIFLTPLSLWTGAAWHRRQPARCRTRR